MAVILKFYFRFRFKLFIVIGIGFCNDLPNFMQIGLSSIALWHYADFPRWRPYRLKSTSGFRFVSLRFKKVKYFHTKFRADISIHGWQITTSGFCKPTLAILKFYFRFRYLPLSRHRRMILHWPAKFYPNWITVDGGMTSYRFSKMAAIASQSTSGFWFGHVSHSRKSKAIIYQISTISTHKRTAAILKLYFRFRCWPFRCHRHVWFSIGIPNFTGIGSSAAELWRHRFSRWRPSTMLDLV